MTDTQFLRKRKGIVRGGRSVSVSPEQFCALAISRQKLARVDDESEGLRGLHDSRSGNVFVVDASELRQWLTRPR